MSVFDHWPIFFLSQRPLLLGLLALRGSAAALAGRHHGAAFWALAGSACVWWLYAAWEVWMLVWRSPTGDMAIRVDALFIEPLMQIVLLIDVVLGAWRLLAESAA